jgi:RNA polymerase sigma-70 factor (ECF subfamily)
LLRVQYSPIAALNRTYALAKVKGKAAAIAEAEKLNLPNNPFYFSLLGELYKDIDNEKAKQNFLKAISFAKTKADKLVLQRQIEALL